MLHRLKPVIVLALAVALLLPLISTAPPAAVEAQGSRQVWAYYMGWWTTQGWADRANVLTDRPLRGEYASQDGGVAAAQIEEAQSAGIDAFLVTWFGVAEQPVTTATLNNLLDQAAPRGFQIGAVIDAFDPNFHRSVDAVRASLSYLFTDRINHPAYLRFNGSPVITFTFQSSSGISAGQWQALRNEFDPGRNTIWIAEGLSPAADMAGGAFDGMHAFNVSWSRNPASTANQQRNQTLAAGGRFYAPTVHPGWNETLIAQAEGRPNPAPVQDRANGAFLTNSWNGAIGVDPEVVILVSWNEYIENSHFEPSQVYGTQSLDVLRGLIAAWKGAAAPAAEAPAAEAPAAEAPAAEAPAAAPAVSTGLFALPNVNVLNVRAQPTAQSARVGQVTLNSRYAILGRNADSSWYYIDFGAGTGWIAARFARYEGGNLADVPVSEAVGGAAVAPAAGGGSLTVTALGNVRIRTGAGTTNRVVGAFLNGTTASLVGRNADSSWVLINYDGLQGWVSAAWVSGDVAAAPVVQ